MYVKWTNRVGKGKLDEDLKKRIDHAEVQAERPWHFCFILGGGWRRSQQAAEAARSAGGDIVLAAVAIRQLASRDAIAKREDIVSISNTEEESETDIQRHLEWLENQRLIIHCSDCRTPHLRFASVVLNQILNGQNSAGRKRIGRMIDEVLLNPEFPFVGLRTLLIGLRLGNTEYSWSSLPQRSTIEALAYRCWQAIGKDRNFAALTLSELVSYVNNGFDLFIDPFVHVFSEWISSPNDGAYGFAHLLHQLHTDENKTAKNYCSKCKSQSGCASVLQCKRRVRFWSCRPNAHSVYLGWQGLEEPNERSSQPHKVGKFC